jgi:hypothetical protein
MKHLWGETRYAYKILVEKPEGKRSLGISGRWEEENILREIDFGQDSTG